MLTALALAATIHVQSGQTLGGIASSNGYSLSVVEAANPGITDPNLIYVGEAVNLPGSGSTSSASVSVTGQTVSPSSYSGFQACVISRESSGNSQVMNSSGHYGLYQFDYSTWVSGGGNPSDFGHASVSEQNAVFQSVYAARGSEPWGPSDGC